MIQMTIQIAEVKDGSGNEFGVGVNVHTDLANARAIPEGEGATFVGICMAINDYMRSRGRPDFDCLQVRSKNG